VNLSLLYEQVTQQDAFEWAGLITGIIYVVLATYEKPSCWIFGIISSGCIAWKSFADYKLMADVILQVFYIVIGIIGIMQWLRGRTDNQEKPIIKTPALQHILAIAGCMLISWPLSCLLVTYADARYGYPDTLLTLLSVWATVLLIRKELYNWVYWMIIDAVYLFLYWRSEGYLFALLFLIYAIISVWGWLQWRGHYQRQINPVGD